MDTLADLCVKAYGIQGLNSKISAIRAYRRIMHELNGNQSLMHAKNSIEEAIVRARKGERNPSITTSLEATI